MPGVVLNEKEKIRGNFKEDRTLESANFEIRKKKFVLIRKSRGGRPSIALKISGPQLILLDCHPQFLTQTKEIHP